MRKIIYLIVVLVMLLITNMHSQNIVINPSFENDISCNYFIHSSVNWYAYRNSPDYFSTCFTSDPFHAVPANSCGYQYPATGNAYAGIICYGANGNGFDSIAREYIGAQLTSPLVIGQKYYVSLKVNAADGSIWSCRSNNMGVLFSTISYTDTSNNNTNITNATPIKNYAHIYTTSVITDTVNWVTISGSLIADSAYNYIIIGNFFDNQHTSYIQADTSAPHCSSYYFVDDICVSTDSLTCMGSTGIKEQELSTQLIIYPNPSTSIFTIQLPTQQRFTLSITDITGRNVYENKTATGVITIDASGFSSGVYFVKAINERTVLTGKLIKE